MKHLIVDKTDVVLRHELFVQDEERQKTIHIERCTRVVIEDLTLIGLGKETPWADGSKQYNGVAAIVLKDIDDCVIRGCHILNHAGGGIILRASVRRTTIEHNTIRGMGPRHINPGDNGADFAIANSGGDLFAEGLLVQDNMITGHAFGCAADCGFSVWRRNMIYDIPGQHGFYGHPGGHIQIIGNWVRGCPINGIKVQIGATNRDYTDPCLIARNLVEDCGQSAVIANDATGEHRLTNVRVLDNTARRCKYGVYLRHCDDAVVQGNLWDQLRGQPVYLDDSNGAIQDKPTEKK